MNCIYSLRFYIYGIYHCMKFLILLRFLLPPMASNSHFLIVFLMLLSGIFTSALSDAIRAPFRPNKFVFPVLKDDASALHVVLIRKRTPQISIPFLVDLNGKFLWVNCEENYLSSTYSAPSCHSSQCSRAGVHYCHRFSSISRPGCHNNTCFLITKNPLTGRNAITELAQDVLSVQSTQDHSLEAGPVAYVPHFLFACASSSLLKRPLPKRVQGVAGFGHTQLGLPIQLASHFGFSPIFALCLSSSTKKNGVIFIGNGPYTKRPEFDISRPISYKPLKIGSQGEYFVTVRSIKINSKPVQIKSSRNSPVRGFVKTMISTTTPYTNLEHSLFRSFAESFVRQLSGVPQVRPVSPFEVCFNTRNLTSTRNGPGVPNVHFALQNRNVIWTIFAKNSMVQARDDVTCLAFVDGGTNPKASIIIGTHQLENHLLQFDLVRSRVGYSSSLMFRNSSCSQFDFSTIPERNREEAPREMRPGSKFHYCGSCAVFLHDCCPTLYQ